MTIKTHLILTLNLLLLSISIIAQENTFKTPVKIPISLSGNFAEIRFNHFHSGIDIRTQGKIGLPVYSIDSGYISRIRVQPIGFGLAIYITHPSGYTSVYAHLNNLNNELNTILKNTQYLKESFEVDLSFNKNEIPIKVDQLIAYSGNSGSSGGPHLHFEVRNTKTQNTIDPINFYPKIKDDIAPVIKNLFIYDIQDSLFEQISEYKIFKKGNIHQSNQNIISVPEIFSFGVEVYDYSNGSMSKNGIEQTSVFLDDQLIFDLKIDSFSFFKTRYANSIIDFYQKEKYHRNIYRTHILPNNKINFYNNVVNNGIIKLEDDKKHNIKIICTDSHGNKSTLITAIKKSEKPKRDYPKQILQYNKDYSFETKGINLSIKKYSLYKNCIYDISIIDNEKFPTLEFSVKKSIFHNPFEISRKIDRNDKTDYSKYIWCSTTKDGKLNGTLKTSIIDNNIIGESRTSGYFTLKQDTTPPQISPINLKNNKYQIEKQIRVIIKDNLSGIKTYNGYIDNKWILFNYDAKNNRLVYTFDDRIIKNNSKKELSIYVTDNCGNIKVFNTKIVY